MILIDRHGCRPHTFQDSRHPGRRVFNFVNKSARGNEYVEARCTVCSKVQSLATPIRK